MRYDLEGVCDALNSELVDLQHIIDDLPNVKRLKKLNDVAEQLETIASNIDEIRDNIYRNFEDSQVDNSVDADFLKECYRKREKAYQAYQVNNDKSQENYYGFIERVIEFLTIEKNVQVSED